MSARDSSVSIHVDPPSLLLRRRMTARFIARILTHSQAKRIHPKNVAPG
jgi:hypothetical protein